MKQPEAEQPSNHPAFVAGPADAGSHETLRALIARWRDCARSLTIDWSVMRDDHVKARTMQMCADELEAALAASAAAPAAPRETKNTE
jgi:hypothetical protein